MADQTITFDTQSGTPYGANLTINGGSNFNVMGDSTTLKTYYIFKKLA